MFRPLTHLSEVTDVFELPAVPGQALQTGPDSRPPAHHQCERSSINPVHRLPRLSLAVAVAAVIGQLSTRGPVVAPASVSPVPFGPTRSPSAIQQ